MKHTTNKTEKPQNLRFGCRLNYSTPKIEVILLDKEISLILNSVPPEGPGESYLQINSQNPLKEETYLV